MKRVRVISNQLLSLVPTEEVDAGRRVAKEVEKEAFEEAAKFREGFFKEVQELEETGKPPALTAFDIDLATDFQLRVPPRENIRKMLEYGEEHGHFKCAEILPGPWDEVKDDREAQIELVNKVLLADAEGWMHLLFAEWIVKYGKRGLNSNIAIPFVVRGGWGKNSTQEIHIRVLLSDAEDCERVSRVHIRKDVSYGPGLFDSVIGTRDKDDWRDQRDHLNEAFMPLTSLARIMPVSLQRAKFCAERITKATKDGQQGSPVDISDFMLHETMAQLQMALLGCDTEQMERLNAPVRGAFGGRKDLAKVGELGEAMQIMVRNAETNQGLTKPSEYGEPGSELTNGVYKGPVSRVLATSDEANEPGQDPVFTNTAKYGNALLVLFAGHDTTGHTMTWLIFELSRHPEIQKRVQKEIDEFFEYLDGRDPEYRDLYRLNFLDRCITEVMRLWGVVPNGTFREMQLPEEVNGPEEGETVVLPKGAKVQVFNYARHMNPDLWGPDVNRFNPDREFFQVGVNSDTYQEIVKVGGPYASVNPQSHRFSPFAYGPRSCLGKNFAQMEMRLILCYLLKAYDFNLSGAYQEQLGPHLEEIPIPKDIANNPDQFRGVSRGTMGPMSLTSYDEKIWGKKYHVEMLATATARVQAREPAVAGVR